MLHQLLEAGQLAKGPCQQGVLHPDGAVRVERFFSSPGQSRHSPFLLGASQENIPLAVAEAALAIVLEGISCELTGL